MKMDHDNFDGLLFETVVERVGLQCQNSFTSNFKIEFLVE